MSRYIDADALRSDLEMRDRFGNAVYKIFQQLIDEQPTANVKEVVHGEWLEKEIIHNHANAKIPEFQSARCSACNKYHTTPYMYYFYNYNYCPNCGAKMDEREKRWIG